MERLIQDENDRKRILGSGTVRQRLKERESETGVSVELVVNTPNPAAGRQRGSVNL